ncbi:hypothetical protein MNBD_ACTINO01-1729, partial [hydrothermal vent metagenome]
MVLALTFLVIVVGVVVGGILMYSRRINTTWAADAERLGLRYSRGGLISGPKISGTLENMPVEVATIPEQVNGYTLTKTTVLYRALGVDFHLDGATTDSGAFEDRFTIVTDAPEGLRAVLTPTRKAALLELLDSHPGLEVTDTALSVTTA